MAVSSLGRSGVRPAHGSNHAEDQILPPVAEMPPSLDFLPVLWQGGGMIRNVAVLVYDGVAPFELGVLHEAWGVDRSDEGLPVMDFAVCAPRPGPVRTVAGFSLSVEHDLSRAAAADLVCVPAMPENGPVPEAVLDALRAAHDRGATIVSLCTGAFVLGEAGALGRPSCTTPPRPNDHPATRLPPAPGGPPGPYLGGPPPRGAGRAAAPPLPGAGGGPGGALGGGRPLPTRSGPAPGAPRLPAPGAPGVGRGGGGAVPGGVGGPATA